MVGKVYILRCIWKEELRPHRFLDGTQSWDTVEVTNGMGMEKECFEYKPLGQAFDFGNITTFFKPSLNLRDINCTQPIDEYSMLVIWRAGSKILV